MTELKTVSPEILQETLERFGADLARWPQDLRDPLQALMANDPASKQLYDEFAALDQVLKAESAANNSMDAAQHDALAARIMVEVARNPRPQSQPDNVVRLDTARKRQRSGTPAKWQWPNVAAAGALAASLLLGISVGATGVADPALAPVSEAFGLGSIGSETVALADPIFDVVDASAFDDDVL